ncbi:MAG: toxic anion resistance protein [Pseudomonadota bacterium]
MSDEIRQKAAAAGTEITALTDNPLVEPSETIVAMGEADSDTQAAINARMGELDVTDTTSIVTFGSSAQEELQQISQSMLADVRNKDLGPAGDSLREIVTTIRGFSVEELDVRRKRTLWEKMTGKLAPFAKFAARYEEVQSQIDRVTDNLLGHEHKLMKDIKALDLLYDKTLAFYDELALYIAAGEAKIQQVETGAVPAKEAELNAASETEKTVVAQELRDLRAARDDIERRVHDLRLTRQVTMQSLPSIRLVQENDKSLITKINSTLVNTVPLWETQLAQAVTIQRSSEAAAAVRDANDLTNELLTANAKNLRSANRAVRQEIERGVFDIAAVRTANEELIGTIEESLAIADEGKAKRAEAEQELISLEGKLRESLASAKSRGGSSQNSAPESRA